MLANCEMEEAVTKKGKTCSLVVKTLRTNLHVVLAVQKDVLRFQVMMKQRWSHVMEKVNTQSDFVQNAQPDRPGQHRICVLLKETEKAQSIKKKAKIKHITNTFFVG